jgi:hypothetical protein
MRSQIAAQTAEDDDFVFGAGDGDVEPALAAFAVERAKVHGDAAGFIDAVTDGEEDHVALVALDAFKAFDEDGFAFDGRCVAEMRFNVVMFAALFIEEVFDEVLLRLAEGDDAEAAFFAGGAKALHEFGDKCARFLGVGASDALVVARLGQMNEANAAEFSVRRWEGEQIVVVIMTIAEGDEAFVAAAVMPLETFVAQALGEEFVEDAFEVFLLDDGFFVSGFAGVEEISGRKLFGIADDDELGAASDGADGIPNGDLRSFVEDDEVETFMGGFEILRDGKRAHQNAGLEAREELRDAAE